MPSTKTNSATVGRRIRKVRVEKGLTLQQLGDLVALSGSQISLLESGKREPKLGTLMQIAEALGVEVSALLSSTPLDERDSLEVALEEASKSDLYRSLGLPVFKINKSVPNDVLENMLGLYRELVRRESETIATPEEARRVNTELRNTMRELNNHLPEVEKAAADILKVSGQLAGSALSHSAVARMAKHMGFEIIHVDDLPHSARSLTDIENGIIYLPPASIPGGHGLRALALQAMAHRVLGHTAPTSYADFLKQRLEINYFSSAVLMPRDEAVSFVKNAMDAKDLAVEDFRDAFGVTHETAAMRLTNIMTSEFDIRMHFIRTGGQGEILKAYENDGFPLPRDVTGSIEGQQICKHFPGRAAFEQRERTTEYYQYTDTPVGTFWGTAQIGQTATSDFSISVGVPYGDAKWFRGRFTELRRQSTCPDENCCRRPDPELASKWSNKFWPSATAHVHILAPLPSGTFPGIDDNEVYKFLEKHS